MYVLVIVSVYGAESEQCAQKRGVYGVYSRVVGRSLRVSCELYKARYRDIRMHVLQKGLIHSILLHTRYQIPRTKGLDVGMYE